MTLLILVSEPDDNYVEVHDPTYADAREAGPGSIAAIGPPNDPTLYVGSFLSGDWYLFEGFFSFDVSAIPLGAVITSGFFTSYVDDVDVVDSLVLEARGLDWVTPVSTGDFIPGSDLAALPLYGSVSVVGATSGLRAMPATAALIAAIQAAVDDATGMVRFVVVTTDLVTANARTAWCRVETGDGGDSFLLVNYLYEPIIGRLGVA